MKKFFFHQKTVVRILFANKYIALLSLTWIIVHTYLFTYRGIITGFEAGKYISQAQLIINHHSLSYTNLWFYSLPIMLIAFALKTSLGLGFVYVMQTLLNGYATYVFFKLSRQLSNSITAFLATFLLIVNIPLQELNNYLQTESLYVSGLILYIYFLYNVKIITIKNTLIITLFVFLLSITRPNGLMLVPSTLLFLYFNFFNKSNTKIIVLFGVLLFLFAIMINEALNSGGEWRFMLAFQKELVICADNLKFTNIDISKNPNSIEGFLYYIYHNTWQFVTLAIQKTFSFFGLYRSYFSLFHNLLLMVLHYPLYILTALSIPKWEKVKKHINWFAIYNIMLAWFVVILTCDDTHNRFFLVTTPYFYLLSLPFLKAVLKPRSL